MSGALVIHNLPERKRAIFRLMVEKKQTIRQFMTQWGGVLNRDLIDWTAPRGRNPSQEKWQEQKKRGERSTERDIRKIFKGPEQLLNIIRLHPLVQARPKLYVYLEKLVRAGDLSGLQRIMAKLGSKIVLIARPSRDLHFPQRGARGRVGNRVKQTYYVPQESPITGYVADVKKDVGKAKAGWITKKLLVRGIPAWVRRHQWPDGGRVDLVGPNYRIDLHNTAATTNGMKPDSMVTPALRILEKKWQTALQKIAAWRNR